MPKSVLYGIGGLELKGINGRVKPNKPPKRLCKFWLQLAILDKLLIKKGKIDFISCFPLLVHFRFPFLL